MAEVPQNSGRSRTTLQGRAEEPLFLKLVARSWKFRGDFVEFSWDFRGSESLRPKHFLTLGPFSWVFRGIFVDPLKTKLVAFSWSFRGFFVGVGTPPATENMRKPTA